MNQNASTGLTVCVLVGVCYVASLRRAALLVRDGVCIIYSDKETVVHNSVLGRTCRGVAGLLKCLVRSTDRRCGRNREK